LLGAQCAQIPEVQATTHKYTWAKAKERIVQMDNSEVQKGNSRLVTE